MKTGLRIALAIYVGFFVYEILLIFWGDAGIFAYRDLRNHRSELQKNVAELEDIGDALEEKRNILLTDAEEIILRARSIGYFRPDEIRVVTPNSSSASLHRTLGRMVKSYTAKRKQDEMFRLIGCGMALLFYTGLTVIHRGSSSRRQ